MNVTNNVHVHACMILRKILASLYHEKEIELSRGKLFS